MKMKHITPEARRNMLKFWCGFFISTAVVIPIFLAIHGVLHITWVDVITAGAAFWISIPSHEFIHAVTGCFVSENNWRTIRITFRRKESCAYCQFFLPICGLMELNLMSAMPGIVLAVIPAIVGLIIGNEWLCIYAVMNFGGASGDTIDCYKRIKTAIRQKH